MSDVMLNVPVIHQIPNSSDCGVACLNMVLEYHFPGKFNYDEIKKQMNFMPGGLTSFSLAIFLLKNGFQVNMVYLHPFLFNLDHKNQKFKPADLIEYIEVMSLKKMSSSWLNTLPELTEFLKLGGELVIDYPKRFHIEEGLQARLPIISLLTTGFLTKSTFESAKDKKNGYYNGHFNLITGIQGNQIFVNDPEVFEPDLEKAKINGGYELGGPQSYNVDDYLFGIYANIGQDIDNGGMIIARPKVD